MRDLRKAVQSAKSKVAIFGIKLFLLKVVEIAISEILVRIPVRLRKTSVPLKRDRLKVNILSDIIDESQRLYSDSFSLVSNWLDYRYLVFGQWLNFKSDSLINSDIESLNNTLTSEQIRNLKFVFGDCFQLSWDVDVINDYKFSNKSIPYNIAEVKVPWDFGRFLYFPQMAMYSDELDRVGYIFQRDVISFYIKNGKSSSIQWANAMEAGIRLHNLCLTYMILQARGFIFEDGFETLFYSGVKMHRKFIFLNNEFSFAQTSNHFACNILGVVASFYFYPSKFQSWLMRKLFNFEVQRNTHEGLLNEGSTAYHRFTSEIYLSTFFLLSGLSGDNKSDEYGNVKATLTKMFNLVEQIENPLGLHTQSGDADGGFLNWITVPFSNKLQCFTPYDVRSYRSFIEVLGKSVNLSINDVSSNGLNELSDRQIIVFRDSKLFVMINNIRVCSGVFNKTHFHDDHGFVEVFYEDKCLSIDPGMPCYTSDIASRTFFQGASAHYAFQLANKADNPFADIDRAINLITYEEDDYVLTIEVANEKDEVLFQLHYDKPKQEIVKFFKKSNNSKIIFVNYLSKPISLS
ncbi:hypothetical protein [Bowmanella sp. JS7-9]|uniref:Heparin-sulfate lyase N-terminal domain-containing protein n=1 Tax=Pseudobowmanella zhangzhouensis TaxID=1537679 RepID=A0ABW1XJX6_9ALTE|nr:hypothetical protein [Bowmanella sp. JS7-9]TBX25665.1 hypothetical protein TK45_02895 [Bowmanella sp. JS7-9]